MGGSESAPITIRQVIESPELRTELEDRLRLGQLVEDFDIVDRAFILDGSHGAMVSRLSSGEPVVVKRSDQTAQGLALGPEGLQWVRNEAVGYEIAKLLGCDDIVIPTVLRRAVTEDGREIELALRLYVEAEEGGELTEGAPLPWVSAEQRARGAMFDLVVEQTDRRVIAEHGGNWYVLSAPDCEPRLLLFDHQLCFGCRVGFGLASGLWDSAGHLVPSLGPRMKFLLSDEARAMLAEYLPVDAVEALQDRVSKFAT